MPPRTALIFSPLFSGYSYGDDHPFKLHRYQLAFDLMKAYGLLELPGMEIRDCLPVSDELLFSFHTPDYIARLREFSAAGEPRADFRYGLGDADCPVFRGMYDYAALGAGATCTAARLVDEEGFDVAFNLAGGWHHAHRARASGFSYINDAVLAINWLVERGRRVAYLDLDAHHGDGVQEAFYDSNRVLTVSLHESGTFFFPGTGLVQESGSGSGTGYSVNIPLPPHTDDAVYMKAFDEAAFPLIAAFDPDILVTQIGADTFRTDPLTRLEVTTHSYGCIMRKLKALRIPWIALGGGGYDLLNSARAWCIAWGEMNGIRLPPRLPAEFVALLETLGYPNRSLFDAMHRADDQEHRLALHAVETSICRIRETIFPHIIGTGAVKEHTAPPPVRSSYDSHTT